MLLRITKLIIGMAFWTVVALVALVVVGGVLAVGLAPLFGWLSPLIVTFLVFLIAQITRTFRRRRGVMALSYLEQAVRLNLPLPRMLEAAQRSESPRLANRLERLRHRLTEGYSVADALADAVPEVPARALAAVGAAEHVGRLQQGLRRTLDQHRAAAARTIGRVDVYRAYPLVMILMIASVMTLISIFIMPKYEQLFRDFGQRVPDITVTTIHIASYAAPVLLIASVVAMLVFVGGLFWETLHARSMQALAGGRLLDRFWWYVPFWHGMQRDEGLAEVCALMSDALSAGMPSERALAEGSRLRINAVLRGRVREWSSRVTAGETLGAGAASARLPQLLSAMLKTARGSDGAIRVFQFLAGYYRSRFSRGAMLVEAALVPVTVLFFAVIVACVAVSLFLPLTALADTLMLPWGVM